jgi:hypothetical protein
MAIRDECKRHCKSGYGRYVFEITNAGAFVTGLFKTALVRRQISVSTYLPGRTGGETASQI